MAVDIRDPGHAGRSVPDLTIGVQRRSQNSAAPGAAAWALVRHAGLTERAAAMVLGMRTGSVVSPQLAKWRRTLVTDARYQAIGLALERRLEPANL